MSNRADDSMEPDASPRVVGRLNLAVSDAVAVDEDGPWTVRRLILSVLIGALMVLAMIASLVFVLQGVFRTLPR